MDTGQGVEGLDGQGDQTGSEPHGEPRAEARQGGEAVSESSDDRGPEGLAGRADASASPPDDAPDSEARQDAETASEPKDDGESSAKRPAGRRISAFEEVADGGFGIGSAAPIADGAQPLGHAVKGTREGRTFLAPSDAGYDDVEPDVWFFNEDAARRAGFDRSGE